MVLSEQASSDFDCYFSAVLNPAIYPQELFLMKRSFIRGITDADEREILQESFRIMEILYRGEKIPV